MTCITDEIYAFPLAATSPVGGGVRGAKRRVPEVALRKVIEVVGAPGFEPGTSWSRTLFRGQIMAPPDGA